MRLFAASPSALASVVYTVFDGSGCNYDLFEIDVTLLTRSIEGPETCTFDVSVDGGETFIDPAIVTLVDGDDVIGSENYLGVTKEVIYASGLRSDGLMLRMSVVANAPDDSCFLRSVTVEGREANTTGPTTEEQTTDEAATTTNTQTTERSDCLISLKKKSTEQSASIGSN